MGIIELAELVRAGLNGDEYVARQAMAELPGATGRWVYSGHDVKDVSGAVMLQHDGNIAGAKHAARHDPATVLRDLAARRELLGQALAWEHGLVRWDHDEVRACESVIGKPCECGRGERVLAVLQALAKPYQETT